MSICCVVGLGISVCLLLLSWLTPHRVVGVDVNPRVVDTVNKGLIHIVEPELDDAVAAAVSSGALSAQLTPSPADVFLIAVPTSFHSETADIPIPNIDFVLSAAGSIAPFLRPGNLILLESTSPVGTTEKVAQLIHDISGLDIDQIHIAYCPERVLPGYILQELIRNDRVIGGLTQRLLPLECLSILPFVRVNSFLLLPVLLSLLSLLKIASVMSILPLPMSYLLCVTL